MAEQKNVPRMARLAEKQWPADHPPLVSLLVCTYNQAGYIGQCLDSLLSQVTRFPVEILVHDDASTDDTPRIVRQYAKRYPGMVRPVFQSENQYSQGRQIWPILHALARGRFIAYCDGDDYWPNPEKLECQVSFLLKHPEFVLSFHDAVVVDVAGRIVKQNSLPPEALRDYSAAELRVYNSYMLFGTLVHRNVGLNFPPEYNLVTNSDNFMPLLLAVHGGAKFQPEAGPLAYRKHQDGVWSGRSDDEQRATHLQSYMQIASYFIRIGDHQAAREFLVRRLLPMAFGFLQGGNQENKRAAPGAPEK